MERNKILYIRSGPYELNFDNYNLQEVGLGKAFCRAGYDFDILYYSKENRNQIIKTDSNRLRILWRKGIKFLRTGLYLTICKKTFLNRYDAIIVSEYSQLMSVIVAFQHPNTYIYNGPYYNLFKIPIVEKFYDLLFCKYLNRRVRKVFCKTEMAKEYIARKGLTNSMVVGVGLDTAKFDEEEVIESETEELLSKMDGYRNLLYVGQIVRRKNVELLIKAFVELKKRENTGDIQLVLVGKGDASYTKYCKSLLSDEISKRVIWCKFIKNAQMKFVYQVSDIFLLPSIQEIFGMVLLEAMYFGVPVISSYSAGAEILIKNGKNGVIVKEFDECKWKLAIEKILNNPQKAKNYGKVARNTICSEFLWDGIASKMIKTIRKNGE